MDRTPLEATKALIAGDMKRRFEIWPGTAVHPPDLKFVGEVLRELLPAKQFEAIWKRVEDWDRREQPCELTDDIFTYLVVHEAQRFEHVKCAEIITFRGISARRWLRAKMMRPTDSRRDCSGDLTSFVSLGAGALLRREANSLQAPGRSM